MALELPASSEAGPSTQNLSFAPDVASSTGAIAGQASTSLQGPLLPPSHPISLRLRSVLTSSHSEKDNRIAREGLKTLESWYAVASSSREAQDGVNGFEDGETTRPSRRRSRRKQRCLIAPEDDDLLSVDIGRARSHLETDSHSHLLQSGDEMLTLLNEVNSSLTFLQDHLSTMQSLCDEMDTSLTTTHDSTRWLLDQASGLERQQKTTDSQRLLLDLFLKRFTLTEEEVEIVTSRSSPISRKFFAAMGRLDSIRQECSSLLEGGSEAGGGTRAGLDVMDLTGRQLEAGFEKLGRYLGGKFREQVREGQDVRENVKEGVKRLMMEREEVLRPPLQTLISLRSSHLSSSFTSALTQGNPSLGTRPIELQAHDPLRYVGDMLAWIHQAVASEREYLGQLLSEREGEGGRRMGERRRGIGESGDWCSLKQNGSTDGHDEESRAMTNGSTTLQAKRARYLQELLDRILSSLTRPLSIRVLQTVSQRQAREGSSCLLSFRLANLVQFYAITLKRTLGANVSLSKGLKELSGESYHRFFEAMERHGQDLLVDMSHADQAGGSLSPPTRLQETIATLREILATHSQSLAEDTMMMVRPSGRRPSTATQDVSDVSSTVQDFDEVVAHLLDPIVESIRKAEEAIPLEEPLKKRGAQEDEEAARKRTEKKKRDGLVFRVNCAEAILTTIASFDFIPASRRRLQEMIDAAAEELTEMEHQSLLIESGLHLIVKQEASAVSPAPSSWDAFLLSPNLLSGSTTLASLASPSWRSKIHSAALERLYRDYEGIVDHQTGNEAGWRSKDEVRMLLGIES